MDDLLRIPSCSSDRTTHLRLVYDKVHANVRCLEALGIGANQYGSFLIPIVMAKLPGDVRLQIARVTTKDVWEIDELLQVLRIEVEAREVSEGVGVHETRSSTTLSFQQRSMRTTVSTMVTQDINILCVYFREGHYSASCTKSPLYLHVQRF